MRQPGRRRSRNRAFLAVQIAVTRVWVPRFCILSGAGREPCTICGSTKRHQVCQVCSTQGYVACFSCLMFPACVMVCQRCCHSQGDSYKSFSPEGRCPCSWHCTLHWQNADMLFLRQPLSQCTCHYQPLSIDAPPWGDRAVLGHVAAVNPVGLVQRSLFELSRHLSS